MLTRSRRLAAITTLAGLAAAPLAGPGPAASAAVTPSRVLYGVAAASAGSAWAVGVTAAGSGIRTLIERWNGRTWKPVPSPDPGNSGDDELLGVSATSARNAWAVGWYLEGSTTHTLIEHWNGTSWRVSPTPSPGCSRGESLYAVAAVSAGSAFAVGQAAGCSSSLEQAEVLRWNGRSWRRTALPRLSGIATSGFAAVTAMSAADAWAVGSASASGSIRQTLIEHWDGRAWARVRSPDPTGTAADNYLSGVVSLGPGRAWAVGTAWKRNPHTALTMILRWDGHRWSHVPSPHPGTSLGDDLAGISGVSATSLFAAGDYRDKVTGDRNLILHWDGRRWSIAHSPTPPPPAHDRALTAIAMTSPADAWAVGGYSAGNVAVPFIEHWNGRSWRREF